MDKLIRVLHVLGGLDAGGLETRLMEIYRKIDREKIQFDFLIHSDKVGFYEKEAKELGANIYRLPKFNLRNSIRYYHAINSFFMNNSNYKVVHGHMLTTAPIYLRIAKRHNIATCIAHSRNDSRTNLNFHNLVKELFEKSSRFFADYKFAVSKEAAISAFGKKNFRDGQIKIIPNSIDTRKYSFNENIRKIKREELGINSELVIGHVGRFTHQKNHNFLIEIFYKLLQVDSNSILILVGDGDLKRKIKDKAINFGIEDKVIFTGIRKDVNEIYQAMDILVFPSYYEGLPGVVLEAQAAGLPCLISDKITKEAKITELVHYMSLNRKISEWILKILDLYKNNIRNSKLEKFKETGYDINNVVRWYENFYLSS